MEIRAIHFRSFWTTVHHCYANSFKKIEGGRVSLSQVNIRFKVFSSPAKAIQLVGMPNSKKKKNRFEVIMAKKRSNWCRIAPI